MSMLSISIDLTRSTEAKSLINKICKNSATQKENSLGHYLKLFMNIEKSFYWQLMAHGVDLANIFLMKSVGDELWFVYSTDESTRSKKEINADIVSILNILFDLVQRSDNLFVSDKDVSWEDEERLHEKAWEGVEFERIQLRRKVYVDYLEDYFDFASRRSDYILDGLLSSYCDVNIHVNKKFSNVEEAKKAFLAELGNIGGRLNLGHTQVEGATVKRAIRSDFIGQDIDLFFRCCKYARPALLMVGQGLVGYISEDMTEDNFRVSHGNSVTTKYDTFFYVKDTLPCGELKGIDKDYNLYSLFKREFPAWIDITMNDSVGSTLAYLTKHHIFDERMKEVFADRWPDDVKF